MTKPINSVLQSMIIAVILTATPVVSAGRDVHQPKPASIDATNTLPPGDLARGLSKSLDVAVFAGGCFWGMEEIIRKLPGVKETQVGYTGGQTSNPSYKEVSLGTTGHAESVQLIFDPKIISYEQLLSFFFRMHDPTTLNQQGNDKGTQYRSVIFYYGPNQAQTARTVRSKFDLTKKWKKPIVTEIVAAQPFWKAEPEHQDYLQKHPNGYTCHYLRAE